MPDAGSGSDMVTGNPGDDAVTVLLASMSRFGAETCSPVTGAELRRRARPVLLVPATRWLGAVACVAAVIYVIVAFGLGSPTRTAHPPTAVTRPTTPATVPGHGSPATTTPAVGPGRGQSMTVALTGLSDGQQLHVQGQELGFTVSWAENAVPNDAAVVPTVSLTTASGAELTGTLLELDPSSGLWDAVALGTATPGGGTGPTYPTGTGSGGVAQFRLELAPSDPVGTATLSVAVRSSTGGPALGSATTHLQVLAGCACNGS